LAAFAIGALAGMFTCRVVPAIVATLAGYTFLALLAGIVISHTAWADHHPASHFWPLQWIEGSCLLALSGLLVALTVWLVHRRAV
jgi:hypothetical protein